MEGISVFTFSFYVFTFSFGEDKKPFGEDMETISVFTFFFHGYPFTFRVNQKAFSLSQKPFVNANTLSFYNKASHSTCPAGGYAQLVQPVSHTRAYLHRNAPLRAGGCNNIAVNVLAEAVD